MIECEAKYRLKCDGCDNVTVWLPSTGGTLKGTTAHFCVSDWEQTVTGGYLMHRCGSCVAAGRFPDGWNK